MNKTKPTKEDLEEARNKKVPDIIAKNLKVLFVGINPGLYTAWAGHHFARPGNRFWSTLHNSGFTPKLFQPEEEKKLLELGCGVTNLVQRATLSAAELTKDEYLEGGKKLLLKIRKFEPRWVAFVGIEAYRKAFDKPKAKMGRQTEKIHTSHIWVLPNPSGLNAHYTPKMFADVFREFLKSIDSE